MLLPLGCLLSYLGVGMTFFICRLELLSRDGFVVSSLTMVISFSQHWFWTFFQTIGLYFLLKYKIDISQVFPVRKLIFWRFFVSYVTADCSLVRSVCFTGVQKFLYTSLQKFLWSCRVKQTKWTYVISLRDYFLIKIKTV